jgi:hypothetical protein
MESQESKAPEKKRSLLWPIIILLVVLNIIAVLLILPFLAGAPDGDQMPDMVRFLGRFHPVLLHLPIGILLLVAVIELGRMLRIGRRGFGSTTVGVFFGAASAVVASLAGFLLYHGGGWEESELAERHLWGGLAVAALACASFGAKVWADAAAGRKAMAWVLTAKFRLFLFATCGVMAFASHDGASLTHGENYLTQYAPDWFRQMMGEEKKPAPAPVKPVEERVIYADIVAPILEGKCTQCHDADKQKGKLRMDTYEFLLAGGKEGPAIEPGSAEKSNIIVRAELDEDDDEHMPPEGKPDLEDHELLLLKWWLDTGGTEDARVGDVEAGEDILAAIEKLQPVATVAPDPDGGGEEPAPAAGGDERAQVEARMAEVPEPASKGLKFESQESNLLDFTAVSSRAEFDDEAMGKLGAVLEDLVSADFSATKITDAGAALLVKARKLKKLRLNGTAVGDASLETIGGLPELESLNLYGTSVTDEGLKKLGGLKTLKKLYLWQTKVTEKGVEELKEALPECEVVLGV